MSTGTVDLSPLVIHVPVDRVEIVDGPWDANWMAVMERLARNNACRKRAYKSKKIYAYFDFTLKTAASGTIFMRRLSLATIFAVQGDTFNFTAIFCGRVVSGIYNVKTRTGWFNLD